jgi:hypothetical protein
MTGSNPARMRRRVQREIARKDSISCCIPRNLQGRESCLSPGKRTNRQGQVLAGTFPISRLHSQVTTDSDKRCPGDALENKRRAIVRA